MNCGNPQHSGFCRCDLDQHGTSRVFELESENASLQKRLDEAENNLEAYRKMWTDAQSACKKHALRGDDLESQVSALKAQGEQSEKRVRILTTIAEDYAEHHLDCATRQWEAGRPTADGGYESKYAGKWYQTRPIDESPKCTCGLVLLEKQITVLPDEKGKSNV